jgi:predicted nucleic acid-binding protein
VILVDTSIWVSHLNAGDSHLKALLEQGEVVCHPFIVGELACGRIKNRTEVLSLLRALPTARMAVHDEVLGFIDRHGLMGIGLGFVDVHLLASALLSNAPLWTTDKPLAAASTRLSINYQ